MSEQLFGREARNGSGVATSPNPARIGGVSRPPFIQHWSHLLEADEPAYSGNPELFSIGSRLAQAMGLTRIAVNHEVLPPGRRTSLPHAERDEEEFVFVIEGAPEVWVDGHLHRLSPGDAVGFPAATGIAHTFINNTSSDVRLLVCGEPSVRAHQLHYPLHPERNALLGERHWANAPSRELGSHNGAPAGGPATQPRVRRVVPTLETERLILRPLLLSDAPAYFEMRQAEELNRFSVHPPIDSLEEAVRVLALLETRVQSGSLYIWAMARRGENNLIGAIGLPRFDAANRVTSLSYELRRDAWGTGLMREAARAVIDYAFRDLGIVRIQGEVDPANERSWKLGEALGFQREGVLRKNVVVRGRSTDTAIYSLLAPGS